MTKSKSSAGGTGLEAHLADVAASLKDMSKAVGELRGAVLSAEDRALAKEDAAELVVFKGREAGSWRRITRSEAGPPVSWDFAVNRDLLLNPSHWPLAFVVSKTAEQDLGLGSNHMSGVAVRVANRLPNCWGTDTSLSDAFTAVYSAIGKLTLRHAGTIVVNEAVFMEEFQGLLRQANLIVVEMMCRSLVGQKWFSNEMAMCVIRDCNVRALASSMSTPSRMVLDGYLANKRYVNAASHAAITVGLQSLAPTRAVPVFEESHGKGLSRSAQRRANKKSAATKAK